VVALPGGEIYSNLQSGAIDATEWVGPWNDLAFGFYKVTKFYYWPGFHEPGSMLGLGINKGVWESLTKTQQAIVSACAAAENDFMLAEFNARNADALDTLVKQHGVQVRQMPDAVLQAIGEASGAVMAEISTSDAMTKKVYDSFLAFRAKSVINAKHSELAYMQARTLPFAYGG
jgi:TRAP-type mannitol/chloroaromatic compound transport system substrate-binding protein